MDGGENPPTKSIIFRYAVSSIALVHCLHTSIYLHVDIYTNKTVYIFVRHLCNSQRRYGVRLLELPRLEMSIHGVRQRHVRRPQLHPLEADYARPLIGLDVSSDQL